MIWRSCYKERLRKMPGIITGHYVGRGWAMITYYYGKKYALSEFLIGLFYCIKIDIMNNNVISRYKKSKGVFFLLHFFFSPFSLLYISWRLWLFITLPCMFLMGYLFDTFPDGSWNRSVMLVAIVFSWWIVMLIVGLTAINKYNKKLSHDLQNNQQFSFDQS